MTIHEVDTRGRMHRKPLSDREYILKAGAGLGQTSVPLTFHDDGTVSIHIEHIRRGRSGTWQTDYVAGWNDAVTADEYGEGPDPSETPLIEVRFRPKFPGIIAQVWGRVGLNGREVFRALRFTP